jgi:hypothetical protein
VSGLHGKDGECRYRNKPRELADAKTPDGSRTPSVVASNHRKSQLQLGATKMSTPNRRRYKYDVVVDRRKSACAPCSCQYAHKTLFVNWCDAFKLVPRKFRFAASLIAVSFIANGCATCQQHPVACTIAGTIIVGSIAASVEHHLDQRHDRNEAMRRIDTCNGTAVVGSCVAAQTIIPFVHPIH